MKKTWLALPVALLTVLAAAAIPAAADPAAQQPKVPVALAENGRGIPDIYIVGVKEGANLDAVLANAKIKETRVKATALRSFSAKLSKRQIEALQDDSSVELILQDQRTLKHSGVDVYTPTDQPGPGWALDRINQAALPGDGNYTTTATGAGVTAYVIDGGIDVNHPDFEGRASEGMSTVSTPMTATCGNYQHGTGVAGMLGGAKFGVAKKVTLVSLRISPCDASASYTDILSATNWLLGHGQKPAVVNMSANADGTGSFQDQIAAAWMRGVFNNLAESGFFITNSTSNRQMDACLGWPADAAGVVAVAHTDEADHAADTSDWGGCIQLYAPGHLVPMPKVGGGYVIGKGSSFAAPMVAGVGALYKATYGDARYTVIADWIKDKSTKNVVLPKLNGNVGAQPTVNRLLNTGGL
ncbi:S8 family serine peptidase [Nocardia sp. NPDC058058]|uniref:S8 family serine peptidase n=1 Tax=Nocardia sp. NPDC058058 TaxID=3346317 RepID=UPI0036D8C834